MDERRDPYGAVIAADLAVRVEPQMRVASLRHLDPRGAFAQRCRTVFGVDLPPALGAMSLPGAALGQQCILAWRHPTTTLLLDTDGAAFDALLRELPPTEDGCCVDQSGGWWALRTTGARVPDLLLRIGNAAAVAPIGHAHMSRMADLPVMSLCVRPREWLLLVDRAYAEHLLDWIRVTVADFAGAAG